MSRVDGPDEPATRLDPSSPTALLLGVSLVVYGAMLLVGGRDELSAISTRTLMAFGANYAPLVREGQWHRLLASTFLHLNPLHLLLNMLALVSIGPMLERDYGRLRFVSIYLPSGIVGSLGSLAWHWRDPVISAGASGALCGIMAAGALSALLAGESRSHRLRTLLTWIIVTLVFGVLVKADNAAHVAGLLAGVVLGAALRPRRAPSNRGVLPGALVVATALSAFGGSVHARQRSESAAELVNRGVELAQAGDEVAAIAAYRRALELEPDDAIAHFDLGLALARQSEHEEAIVHLARAHELEPNDSHRRALAGAHVNHGVALARAGDFAAALAAYRRALQLDETNANTHRNLALALSSSGDASAALSAMRRAVELQSDVGMKQSLAALLADQAIELARAGRHAGAVALYREALVLSPVEWRLQFNLGLSLRALGEHDPAIEAFERAHEIASSEVTRTALAEAIEARQQAREAAGDLSGALDDLGRSTLLRLSPADAGAAPR